MKQFTIFEELLPKFTNNKPIRLIELFAGYGSQALALKYLGVEFEHYKVVEFDKKVVARYNQIHETEFTPIDIKDVGELEIDYTCLNIVTYSFPCQDLSKAGQGKGMAKGENTRSGLLWEVERILLQTPKKPQVLLMENVPDVIGAKNIKDFQEWREALEKMGYSNYVELLNAKNYGIPHNRNRAFMVSILGESVYSYPPKTKFKYKLKDMLENEVDEKYWLTQEQINKMLSAKYESQSIDRVKTIDSETINAITTMGGGNREPKIAYPLRSREHRGFSDISPTLTARDYKDPKIVAIPIPNATKKGFALAEDGDGVYLDRPHQKRGVVQKGMAQTIKCNGNDIGVVSLNDQLVRIRKLTPKECFRLMGVKDSDSEKLTCSNSQKYALAGNSIVTTVLMAIFGELLGVDYTKKINVVLKTLKGEQSEKT